MNYAYSYISSTLEIKLHGKNDEDISITMHIQSSDRRRQTQTKVEEKKTH